MIISTDIPITLLRVFILFLLLMDFFLTLRSKGTGKFMWSEDNILMPTGGSGSLSVQTRVNPSFSFGITTGYPRGNLF